MGWVRSMCAQHEYASECVQVSGVYACLNVCTSVSMLAYVCIQVCLGRRSHQKLYPRFVVCGVCQDQECPATPTAYFSPAWASSLTLPSLPDGYSAYYEPRRAGVPPHPGAEGTLLTGPAAWSNKQADQPPVASTKGAQEGGSGARRARQEADSKGQASKTGCQPRGSKACTCQEAPHMSTCVPVCRALHPNHAYDCQSPCSLADGLGLLQFPPLTLACARAPAPSCLAPRWHRTWCHLSPFSGSLPQQQNPGLRVLKLSLPEV